MDGVIDLPIGTGHLIRIQDVPVRKTDVVQSGIPRDGSLLRRLRAQRNRVPIAFAVLQSGTTESSSWVVPIGGGVIVVAHHGDIAQDLGLIILRHTEMVPLAVAGVRKHAAVGASELHVGRRRAFGGLGFDAGAVDANLVRFASFDVQFLPAARVGRAEDHFSASFAF